MADKFEITKDKDKRKVHSTRDRRLLVIAATAAVGRADLIHIQARGALTTTIAWGRRRN